MNKILYHCIPANPDHSGYLAGIKLIRNLTGNDAYESLKFPYVGHIHFPQLREFHLYYKIYNLLYLRIIIRFAFHIERVISMKQIFLEALHRPANCIYHTAQRSGIMNHLLKRIFRNIQSFIKC